MDEQLAPEDQEALQALFVVASAPATATELAGATAVLAAFDSIAAELLSDAFFADPDLEDGPLPGLVWGGEPGGRRSRNAAKMAAAAAVAALAMGGTAAAATGSLPAPLQKLAHQAFGVPDAHADHADHAAVPVAPVVPPAGRTSPRPDPTHAAAPAPTPSTAPSPQSTPGGTPEANATPEPTPAATDHTARDACRTLATGKGGSRIDAWETLLPLAAGEPVWRYCATVPGTPQFAWVHGAAAKDRSDDRRGGDGDRSDRDSRRDARHEARDDRRHGRDEARDDRRDSRDEAREDRRQAREERAQLRERRQDARDSRRDDRGDRREDRREDRRGKHGARIDAAPPASADTNASAALRVVTIRVGDASA